MATERTREIRDWINFALTILTVLIVPIGLLVLRNQRLEIREEMRQDYVTKEIYKVNEQARDATSTRISADITELNLKLDRMQIQLARLMDAVKLKDQNP